MKTMHPLVALQLILITLKLTEVIDVPWVVILIPLWAPWISSFMQGIEEGIEKGDERRRKRREKRRDEENTV